ncbi:putative glycosyltransferase [Actinoplanes missouriensis 431]|uniref:Putative glycosyltransferase n=1 Tax=Actinoplanes missouriensis (strain ATCC 14538 / DSM 43046 / CBS 188.64 / JCM 3121 / NBRC 102363 / NCIMB 12654 / NRRL B-3342 / UNCC 431) TaxID=512565 RepID=I0H9S7_ACTM4|nr:glycosyltransferase family 4 protein [Actinoplanes missouriensis]BAL89764.1 putative glycosyltransferase [Actinoplanes missouriensis 431]
MNIRYILHNAYGVGGTIRTVFNQANALCDSHDVEIASVYRTGQKPALPLDPRVRLVCLTELRDNGSRFTDAPGTNSRFWRKTRRFRNPLPHGRDFRYKRWDPYVDMRVIRYMRAQRDGVLITTRPSLNLLSAWFGPQRLIRIGQDHMNFDSYKPPLQTAMVRAYPRLDAVTVLTRADLGSYREAMGDRARLVRIPNGIPARSGVPDGQRAPIVAAAGRLSRQKGFDLLVEAFAQVHAEHPDWQLHLFGEGKWRPKLTAMIAERGLEGTVRLRGLSRTLDAEFARASIFALSSRKEGLPMVLLEAMSTGLPVVAFDCPTGPADVVDDGVNGLLVPAEDVPGMAAGLSRLIENGDERTAMGKDARVTAAGYEMPVIVAQWEKLFAELAAR